MTNSLDAYNATVTQSTEQLQEQLQSQFFTKSFHIADPDSYERDLRNVQIVYNQMLKAAGVPSVPDSDREYHLRHYADIQTCQVFWQGHCLRIRTAFPEYHLHADSCIRRRTVRRPEGTAEIRIHSKNQIFTLLLCLRSGQSGRVFFYKKKVKSA